MLKTLLIVISYCIYQGYFIQKKSDNFKYKTLRAVQLQQIRLSI